MLGGRLRLKQPRRGHRVGHDAILLAAAARRARATHVVDLGAGVGAAGLALAARVDGCGHAGRDRCRACRACRRERAAQRTGRAGAGRRPRRRGARARVCRRRARRPKLRARHDEPAVQRSGAPPPLARCPPPSRACRAARDARRLDQDRGAAVAPARHADPDLAGRRRWPRCWPRSIRAFGAVAVLPVHPKPDEPAIRILVRAAKASRAPLAILPGLVLNDRAGRPTPEAEAVLRAGNRLACADARSIPMVDENRDRVKAGGAR